MKKYTEIINVSYYFAGEGYSSTETASSETVDFPREIESYDADDYRDFIQDWTEGHKDEEGRWYKVNVDIYEENADPIVDEPIKSIEFTASYEDGELKIEA